MVVLRGTIQPNFVGQGCKSMFKVTRKYFFFQLKLKVKLGKPVPATRRKKTWIGKCK